MPRLAAFVFLAGVAAVALPRRRAPVPIIHPAVLSDEAADRLARLLCDCRRCMPSRSVH